MNCYVYSWILLVCCFLLAGLAVFLAVRLRSIQKKTAESIAVEVVISEEEILLEKIAYGLKHDEFKMYLQFIVDNKTKKIVSAEALSRWQNADGELIFPGKYIPVMEKSGMIVELDYYMFEKACQKLAEWNGTAFGDLAISCNFTRITISDEDFVTRIKEIANRYNFDRHNLHIEITEDVIEKNMDTARENVLWAKELGFCIALDDIGSGYTSLMNLCEYPIEIVKIDRQILLLTNTESGKKLFLGIIALVHYLQLKLVCEGVETEEQNALVTASDCDYVQGWYYSKAIPEEKADEFAKNYMENL